MAQKKKKRLSITTVIVQTIEGDRNRLIERTREKKREEERRKERQTDRKKDRAWARLSDGDKNLHSNNILTGSGPLRCTLLDCSLL